MTSKEFSKLMTRLTQRPDWSVAFKQILAEIESNDPRLNALLDQFVRITPETKGESRIKSYLLLSTMKMLALDHLGILQNYNTRDGLRIPEQANEGE